jgi:hypothetical protein
MCRSVGNGWEWTEYRLTPGGWQSGSKRTYFDCTKKLYPLDRVATERRIKEQSPADNETKSRTELLWESDDKQLVRKLRGKSGPSPESL